MARVFLVFAIFIFANYFCVAEAIRCYQCSYVKGVNDGRINPDCVDNLQSGSVALEEGAACIRAEGKSGGNWFVLRLAYRPGFQQITLPAGQQSATCAAANVNVTRVGDKKIDSFDSCQVCNDREACNSANLMRISIFILIVPLLKFLY